jgi:group II intron reverse transcriptase/maturase
MELIEKILSEENLEKAIRQVKANKGASGIDKMNVDELDDYFSSHKSEMISSVKDMTYKPKPVRRVYIPKPNGKKRPLGIPTVVDRVIQQAIAQQLSIIYEPLFSNNSYGFRLNRSAHDAIEETLNLINEGYDWIIDLDIEKYFDTVNHDKLISILREEVNDKVTLHVIRQFLKAGVMEDGLVSSSIRGVPQGGPLSPVLSNIYLDKFDKELENRGLHFIRYADDVVILVKSELSANRVMESVTAWLEKKLFLKVSATKTKVVRPSRSNFLGFTFWKDNDVWKCKPQDDRVNKLYDKCRKLLVRKRAIAMPTALLFTKLNQIIRGWINYFHIGSMKRKLMIFGKWLRHKVRVVILKKWKRPRTIYKNLMSMNKTFKCNFTHEQLLGAANARQGLYSRAKLPIVNFILSPKVLAIVNKKKGQPGLVMPLEYYLSK